MNTSSALFLLGTLLCAAGLAYGSSSNPRLFTSQVAENQFDVIIFNTINTNFRKFEYNFHNGFQLYAVGTNLFPVNLTSFSVNYDDDYALDYSFIDVSIFNDQQGDLCVVGPSHYETLSGREFFSGFTIPLAAQVGTTPGSLLLGTGYAPYALDLDPFNQSQPVIYFATWAPTNITQMIQMAVIRGFLDFQAGYFNPNDPNALTWSQSTDIVTLYMNQFSSFTNSYRPWIFHSYNHSEVVVIDPNTNSIYRVDLTGNQNPMSLPQQNIISLPLPVVSAYLHHETNQLFVGVKGLDFSMTGSIYVVDMTRLQILKTIPLQANESDPRALKVVNNTLYVGLYGGPHIVQISLTTYQATGYVRLPYWLYNVQAIEAFNNSLILATYEPIGKIFRVNTSDFCSSPCPEFGYCTLGQCKCLSEFEMKNGVCNWKERIITNTVYREVRGGEIALGILFALTFVTGAIGWLFWWRARRGISYEAVGNL